MLGSIQPDVLASLQKHCCKKIQQEWSAVQTVSKKERTVGKYIIIIVICSKKCPVLYKTGKNCIKINKKRYRFCSLCRLVSSELDDASSKKNQKKDTIRTYFYKKRKPNFQKLKIRTTNFSLKSTM